MISTDTGHVAYLKSFRLSAAQVRRGRLLRALRGAGWNLDRAARALETDQAELRDRLARAQLGHLLEPGALARHRGR
ncbi:MULTISPECIES: hypothetical protein [unclassified Nocardiopsis]|uniref:hypothetical protein n=1 Tax=unclassified Nocardiopsis TaxID=2649073 RepID=UPI00135AD186|nr:MULTISPECIES: hypothetical protein [unclassified Nocardiopsis]